MKIGIFCWQDGENMKPVCPHPALYNQSGASLLDFNLMAEVSDRPWANSEWQKQL